MFRIAIIGLGYRGQYLQKLILAMPRCFELVAVADPDPNVQQLSLNSRFYADGVEDYKRMISLELPDVVVVASPWQMHLEHATYAISAGCHVALEIKAGLALDEYEPLIALINKNGCKLYPLENTIFRREILSVWNMCLTGVFGELIHMRGGYRHDLRHILIDEAGNIRDKGEGKWRIDYYLSGQADIYPSHGFAPLALFCGLGKHDSIHSVTSYASKSVGLSLKMNDETRSLLHGKEFLGDIISTAITTKQGVLITLTHDTTLPRPRSLDWEVQGTLGIWDGDTRRIYIDGSSPNHQWEDDEPYIKRYEHPYWEQWGAEALAVDAHHAGMDYIMLRALYADLSGEHPFPVDIHDLALWCSITPLSRLSLEQKSIDQ